MAFCFLSLSQLNTLRAPAAYTLFPCVLCLVCFFCPMCMSSSVHCSFLTRAPFPFRLSCAKKTLASIIPSSIFFMLRRIKRTRRAFISSVKMKQKKKRTYQKNLFPYIPFPMKVSLYGYTSFYTCFFIPFFLFTVSFFSGKKHACMVWPFLKSRCGPVFL